MYRLRKLVSICLVALGCSAVGASGASALPGDLDPTFGGDGTVITDFGGEDGLGEIALQPDGKIMAVGSTSGRIATARYNPDGSLDPGYGGGGTVVTSIAASSGREIAIQPDGRILVAGTTSMGNAQDILILRYFPDGTLDPSFDGDGSAIIDFGAIELPAGLVLAPDGSFYVGVEIVTGGEEDLAVARFLSNGALDMGFGAGGGAAIDLGFEEHVAAIALQPDGKVVATGFVDTNPGFDQVVARINPDGSPDSSFDGDGVVVTDQGGFEIGSAIGLQSDGKIVVGGVAGGGPVEDASLSRYVPDGSFDPALAGDGFTAFDLGGEDSVRDLAIQADGKLVLAAGLGFGTVRMTSDGQLDPEFGLGGVTAADLGADAEETAVEIQPDGAIVVAGTARVPNAQDNFALARFAGGDPLRCRGRLATIVATPGVRTAGTSQADVIAGTAGPDRIKSGKGRDEVCALGGKDRVNTGAGNDFADGGKGKDTIRGGPGRDRLKGGAANDTLNGGDARDILAGGKGKRDRCITKPGNDRARSC